MNNNTFISEAQKQIYIEAKDYYDVCRMFFVTLSSYGPILVKVHFIKMIIY